MALALRKRPVPAPAIDAAIEHVEEQLLSAASREVPSSRIGEMVMQELHQLDKWPTSALPACTAVLKM